uniref:Tail protein n=1 Tax=Aliivibrio phage vB_Alvi_H905 TaxID=3234039 RepID=A0AB39C9V8_9VIRU
MFYKQDTQEALFHFDDNNEFTHCGVMTIRKHTGLPAKCTLIPVPEHNPINERCYFINNKWIKTELFIGRGYWDEEANLKVIKSVNQDMPESYSFIEPPEAEEGYAVRLVNNKWKQLEDHRGKLIYSISDCTELEDVEHVGPIKEGFTLKEPVTPHDEWIDDGWVTNESNRYIAEYNAVDELRRVAYRNISDPLYMESIRKESNGLLDEARDFKNQADEAVKLIQLENPFPIAL